MCVIIVYGIPDKTSNKTIKVLLNKLIESIHGISELGLKEKLIPCHFPQDLIPRDASSEITILVVGLFDHPMTRTVEVRERLAISLESKVRELFPLSKLIQCQINYFDPRSGFAYSSKEE
ncbi:MAG: hypothetical protein WCJ57_00110 [Candidatus Falkowbacteria bacterium]